MVDGEGFVIRHVARGVSGKAREGGEAVRERSGHCEKELRADGGQGVLCFGPPVTAVVAVSGAGGQQVGMDILGGVLE
jgi:hypothetical protein